MKPSLTAWAERLFYAPTPFDRFVSSVLLPLSWLYCLVMWLRFKLSRPVSQGIAVVSVGNLTVGGSGKTPLVCALAAPCERPAVVLRGYGRKSRGLLVVSDGTAILRDVYESGDEAMIYAHKLPHAVVIVSEVREPAIAQAREMGCNVLFLDDGYSKHRIEKLDLLIEVDTPNRACLPAGPYRERLWRGKSAVVLREGEDFSRRSIIRDATGAMSLVTAIARPQRLDAYLPEVRAKRYFPDHHYFSRQELEGILEESGAESLLVTYKDYVKILPFGLPVSLLDLELEVSPALHERVREYVNSYDKASQS